MLKAVRKKTAFSPMVCVAPLIHGDELHHALAE